MVNYQSYYHNTKYFLEDVSYVRKLIDILSVSKNLSSQPIIKHEENKYTHTLQIEYVFFV